MPPSASIPTMGRRSKVQAVLLTLFLTLLAGKVGAEGPRDGLLRAGEKPRFPIGFYAMPDRDDGLKAMAEAGINLVRCRDRAELDRCREAGLLGWIPLPVDAGLTDALKTRVIELRDHPALGVWEGPDEIVWNFTTFSGLAETANITRDDWLYQRPNAVAYARKEAAKILPRMREAIDFVRRNDPKHRPFWINEAGDSDVIYVREYLGSIDVAGCDIYPVKAEGTNLAAVGKMTDRWLMTGRGKPVWMVLQACSWHRVRPERYKQEAYPSFSQTRFMAWDAVVHGARGILYWGSEFVDDSRFLTSIYAMTAELAALQPFLIGLSPEDAKNLEPDVERRLPKVRLIEADLEEKTRRGVRMTFRQAERDQFLIALVNEDDIPHHGVEIRGLDFLEGRDLVLLYGDEAVKIVDGELMTRMQPYETKLFATSRRWESSRRSGRDFR